MSAWSTSSSKYVPPTQRNKQLTKTYDKNIISNNGNSNTNKFNSKKEKTIELTNEFIEESFPSIGGNSDIMNSTAAKALPVISFASAIKRTQETNYKNSKNYKNNPRAKLQIIGEWPAFLTTTVQSIIHRNQINVVVEHENENNKYITRFINDV